MKRTLLLEITHPDENEPLRLMCGHGFDVLRTDNTGREIYGLQHEGEDYLLFPLAVDRHDDNALAVTFPAAYGEFFDGWRTHGARVLLKSPHGIPYFPGIAEQFQSGRGMMRKDGEGGLTVILDPAEPGRAAKPSPEGEREHDGRDQSQAARSGHGGHHTHPPHGRNHGGEPHEHGPGCACGHDHGDEPHEHGMRERLILDDASLADAIRKRAEGLNLLLRQAADAGLVVEMSLEPSGQSGEACPQLSAPKIMKLL